MIELINVSKYYNNNGIISNGLHNVNLKLSKGEIVAITGDSGSGKSTLLNVITKMDSFDEGEICFKGNETSYFTIDDMDHFRKNKVGFIFQNYNIIDSYSVLKNVMLPLILNGFSTKDAKNKAIELIEKVGLAHRIHHRGSKLSGGEKQRCVIARALAYDCEILACDEPTGNLDSETGKEIIKLIKEVAKDKLVLIVTHNYEQVEEIITRKIKMFDGEIVEDKCFEEVDNQENVELNLDYVPIKRKVGFKVAIDNLLFTPKKTIFVSLVILFVAFLSLSLYQVCYVSVNENTYESAIGYKGENKIIVYNDNHEEIDLTILTKLTDQYTINSFIEGKGVYLTSSNFSFNAYYEMYPDELVIDGGETPNNEKQAILLIPAKSSYATINNKDLLLGTYEIGYAGGSFKFDIVGYQVREDVTSFCITGSDAVYNRMRFDSFIYEIERSLEGFDIYIENFGYTDKKTYLSIPKDYQGQNITFGEFKKSGIYDFDLNDEIDIVYENTDEVVLYISNTIPLLVSKVYEVALYGDKDDLIKAVTKAEYEYLDPATFTLSTSLETFLMNLLSYMLMVFASIAIVIIYYISYLVLMKVYISKKKDYNILRTLGVTKVDMRKIVRYELVFLTIIISTIIYAILFACGKLINISFFSVYRDITFTTSALYFIVMILFGYLLANRFNKKIFKFSVNQVFKKGVDVND